MSTETLAQPQPDAWLPDALQLAQHASLTASLADPASAVSRWQDERAEGVAPPPLALAPNPADSYRDEIVEENLQREADARRSRSQSLGGGRKSRRKRSKSRKSKRCRARKSKHHRARKSKRKKSFRRRRSSKR